MATIVKNEDDLNTLLDEDLITEDYALEILGLKNIADFRKFSRSFMKLSKIVKGIEDGKANLSHTHDDPDIISLDASKLKGTIDIARLPASALERCVVVADDTARFKLTKSQVQNGDSVKVTSPDNLMYIVVDDNKLNSADGYVAYSAAVKWETIKDKPETFPPSTHNHDGKTITALTGYAKSSAIAGISPSDSLLVALGKLEKALDGKAASSHGNHVPNPQSANNKIFLRNDNTWQPITPANIGAEPAFSKNTGFNKPFGTTSNTVLEGAKLAEILGLTYGGSLNTSSAKTVNYAYYDRTTKKVYKCIKATSINYADATYFTAISNNDLLVKLQNLTYSLNEKGYLYIGKLLIQWGSIKTTGVGYIRVTFPIAFPTKCVGVFPSLDRSTQAGDWRSMHSVTNTSVYIGQDGGTKAYWLAIGY